MEVIVVGGGLGGLAIALGLAKLEHCSKVYIIEKQPDFLSRLGATLGVAPNGIKALRELFSHDNDNDHGIEDHSSPLNQLLQQGKLMGTGGRALTWYKVRDLLLSSVQDSNKITMHSGCVLEDISEQPRVLAKCSKNGETFHIEGDFLIGADGVNSKVRDCLNAPKSEFSGTTLWRGCLNITKIAKQENENEDDDKNNTHAHATVLEALLNGGFMPFYTAFDETNFGIFNHHPECPGMLTWIVNTKEHPMEKGTSPNALLEPLLEPGSKAHQIFQAIHAHADTNDFHRPQELKTIRPMESWGGAGKVTLLGDSAHAIRPASGLGSSLAFEDCVILLRKLRSITIKDENKDENKDYNEKVCMALREYEKERLERVQKIWDNEWKIAESAYKGRERYVPTEEYTDWLFAGV